MSSTLQVLVLHPHSDCVTGTWHNPGDVVFWSPEDLTLREQSAPFPYFSVLSGDRPPASAGQDIITLKSNLPSLADTVRLAATETAIDNVAAVSERSTALLREGYFPVTESGFVDNDISVEAAIVEPMPLTAAAPFGSMMDDTAPKMTVVSEDLPMGSVRSMQAHLDLPTNEPADVAPLTGGDNLGEAALELPTNAPAEPDALEDPEETPAVVVKPKRGRKAQ